MAIAKPARRAIRFLPLLSAILPQIGAIMPAIRKVMPKTRPDQSATSSLGTPSSNRYIGRNGIIIV